jgi:tRNA(fMet)-specific endonuclease VapC
MTSVVKYLLDTDMCIYLLNGDERIKSRVAQAGVAAISVSILTVGELYFGAYNSARLEANLERIREFLSSPGPIVLSIDDAAAKYFGKFKAALRHDGKPIGDVDLLIAVIAASRGLKVVTNNTEHFERIAEISLENWLRSRGVSH